MISPLWTALGATAASIAGSTVVSFVTTRALNRAWESRNAPPKRSLTSEVRVATRRMLRGTPSHMPELIHDVIDIVAEDQKYTEALMDEAFRVIDEQSMREGALHGMPSWREYDQRGAELASQMSRDDRLDPSAREYAENVAEEFRMESEHA